MRERGGRCRFKIFQIRTCEMCEKENGILARSFLRRKVLKGRHHVLLWRKDLAGASV